LSIDDTLVISLQMITTSPRREAAAFHARRLVFTDFPKALGIGTLVALSCAAHAQVSPAEPRATWRDTFVARIAALALVETLNAELLSHDSATLTLEHWCGIHRIASPSRITAMRVAENEPPSAEQRQELQVTATDLVKHRRVRLLCGSTVLSEADNWYVPARLTPEMNKLLDSSDVPFGKVVQSLHFQRHTLSAELLWEPLPDGWEMSSKPTADGAGELMMPPILLRHRALLTLPDGTPISEVVESYTRGVLSFPAPSYQSPAPGGKDTKRNIAYPKPP
jgi:hypothetical protein